MPAVSFDKQDGCMVLPAQHPLTLAKHGKAPNRTEPTAVQQVYSPGFKSVLNIPISAIAHLPPGDLHITRLVLCANYDADDPIHSCSMGQRCKFVHADSRAIKVHEIHVNYAWRTLKEVEYERYSAGQVLRVNAPNGSDSTDIMDSCLVLKTKVLELGRSPLTHCAHYYYNRTCNMGADCQFIHAVFIDPSARLHQRAPAPSQIGRGKQPVPRSSKPRAAPTGGQPTWNSVPSASRNDDTPEASYQSQFVYRDDTAPQLPAGTCCDQQIVMDSGLMPTNNSQSDAGSTALREVRYRRNPYSVSHVKDAVSSRSSSDRDA